MSLQKLKAIARLVLFSLLLVAVFYVVVIVTATHKTVVETHDLLINADIRQGE